MLVLVRTVTGLERLTAAELAEAHHRVIDVSKRQLVIESTDTIVKNPPRLADDLFLIQTATRDPGPTKPSLTTAIANLRRQLLTTPTNLAPLYDDLPDDGNTSSEIHAVVRDPVPTDQPPSTAVADDCGPLDFDGTESVPGPGDIQAVDPDPDSTDQSIIPSGAHHRTGLVSDDDGPDRAWPISEQDQPVADRGEFVSDSAKWIADRARVVPGSRDIQAGVPDPSSTEQSLARDSALPVDGRARMNLDRARPRLERGDFAVTASFVGRRNYNRFDIEDLVGAVLSELTGGRYHSRRTGVAPPANRVDWRVTLDGTTMWVGVRPFAVPLHRRAWRRRTITGSLHPPVAAAMARLASLAPGQTVLDAFCGAGTILLEAHAIQPAATYRGIDRSPAAVTAARLNGPELTWQTGDAARLPGLVDRILTNPPWDVRLRLGDFRPYLREWRRALRSSGRLVAILNPQQATQLTSDAAWRVIEAYDVTVAGQHPQIIVAEPNCR